MYESRCATGMYDGLEDTPRTAPTIACATLVFSWRRGWRDLGAPSAATFPAFASSSSASATASASGKSEDCVGERPRVMSL